MLSVRARSAAALTVALALAGFASSCGDAQEPADPGALRAGARVFTQGGCATCHTLAAPRARGRIGPNLDQLRPDADAVARQVREGGGGMPAYADRLSEEEIGAVGAYVAEVAGRQP